MIQEEGSLITVRILISAGGTAGHVLPALTVLKALESMQPLTSSAEMSSSHPDSARNHRKSESQALFVGERDGMEQDLVTREGVDFEGIQAGALHGVGVTRMVRSVFRLLAGFVRAFKILGRYKPDVVFLTGGFVGVPVSVAAWLRRIPAVVYLPDIEPGLALKVMARLASKVATTTDASAPYIAGRKMVVTGYPVRDLFKQTTAEKARVRFGIGPNEKVVLVVGGSTGARSINRAVIANLQALLAMPELRMIHITGKRDWNEVSNARNGLTPAQQARYLAFQYLHEEMADAMLAADLAVCRSGASALGELPFVGLPAILVPYPYAWRYQKVNAQFLVERGAALIVEDAKLSSELVQVVQSMLNDQAKLGAMRRALLSMGGRDGAREIAQLLLKVAKPVQMMA
jgi:UDP-N-acetylglucosamine--N-acetylmuramyl-(pentapeptide) pyrophosphoryl-undecaprenol N-acetylglucosamine transferase